MRGTNDGRAVVPLCGINAEHSTSRSAGSDSESAAFPRTSKSNQQVMKNKKNLMRKTLLSLTAGVACIAGSLTTASADTIIVPVNQTWRWMDASSGTLCLDGTGWQAPGFDDSAWGGPDAGGFTGGENTPATLTALTGLLGTTNLPAPPANSGSPAYFRTHFNPGPTNNLSLILSNRYDDQIVFYINGTRVGAFNHAANPETCTISTESGGEAVSWVVLTLTPAQLGGILLPNTDNVLAVSVHQNATTSSDMVMVCAVSSTTAAPPPVVGAIPFGASGSTNFTFDGAPPAQQWSTRLWPGGNTDIGDEGSLATAAMTNDVSIITDALVTGSGDPPTDNNRSLWVATPGYIATRPTGVAYGGILATLTNISATTFSGIGINYTLTVNNTQTTSEQIAGHLVFWSTSGTPGTWTQITALHDQASELVNGTYPKSATVDLSTAPFTPGGKLYILWVDDNAINLSPDAANEIDNVQFTTLNPTPPTFCNQATDPTNRTVVQCASTTLSAPVCAGFPAPTLQWFHGASPITGATNSSYTIASMTSADAGTYHLNAVNVNGNSNSHTATITYQAAPSFALIRALVNVTNPTETTLSFNLAVDTNTVDPFSFTVQTRTAPPVPLNSVSAEVVNGTNVVLTTDPVQEGIDYDVVTVTSPHSLCPDGTISGTFPVFQAQPLVSLGQSWHYLDNDVDPGASWFTAGFDDSAWKQGAGPFDAKKAAGGTAGFNCRDVTLYGLGAVGSCLSLSNSAGFETTNCFFRTHFNYSGTPASARLLFHGKLDDTAYIYLNGTEVWRVGASLTNGTMRQVYGTNYGGFRTVGDTEGQDSIELLAPAGLITGNNLLAVQLIQESGTSSDLTMGLEVDEVLSTVHPKLLLSNDGFDNIISWGAGTLETSSKPTGPWTTVSPVANPYTLTNGPGNHFYRVKR